MKTKRANSKAQKRIMKAVIFDMDGVIVDSEPFYAKAWIQTYKEIGITIDEDYYFKNCQGKHSLVSSQQVLEAFKKEGNPEELMRRKEALASQLIKGNIKEMPGVSHAIKHLAHNYTLGLASSTCFITVNTILTTLNIKHFFKVIHTAESVTKGKPNPEVYLKTANMLGIEPKECTVIEDSTSGIISAKTAGMRVIGLLNNHNSKESLSYADITINNFKKLTNELIEDLA